MAALYSSFSFVFGNKVSFCQLIDLLYRVAMSSWYQPVNCYVAFWCVIIIGTVIIWHVIVFLCIAVVKILQFIKKLPLDFGKLTWILMLNGDVPPLFLHIFACQALYLADNLSAAEITNVVIVFSHDKLSMWVHRLFFPWNRRACTKKLVSEVSEIFARQLFTRSCNNINFLFHITFNLNRNNAHKLI